MEHSASEPAFDYKLPRVGIEPRLLHGSFNKAGNDYVWKTTAMEAPGPGKYLSELEKYEERQRLAKGHLFLKGPRGGYKVMNKVPAPHHYEDKNFFMGASITGKETLSNIPRVLGGKISKGPRRSFLESAQRHGSSIPSPGQYTWKDPGPKILSPNLKLFKSNKKKPPEKEIGPAEYQINYSSQEETPPAYSIPRSSGHNLLAKAGKNQPAPGPGFYPIDSVPSHKISRGTRYCQTRGLGRSPCSGYF
mmetsp:Transcript_22953/g.42184  ORF Transcript_22953/g.42184 Transcript_22953/m.42184 type:complete len:248 (-) Transcript_22953:101-844(-)